MVAWHLLPSQVALFISLKISCLILIIIRPYKTKKIYSEALKNDKTHKYHAQELDLALPLFHHYFELYTAMVGMVGVTQASKGQNFPLNLQE